MKRKTGATRMGLLAAMVLAALCLSLAGCGIHLVSYPAQDGLADLSTRDLCSGKVVQIRGNWRVFWHELLSTSEVASAFNDTSQATFQQVPKQWNQSRDAKGKEIGAHAAATLAVKVRLNAERCSLGKSNDELAAYIRETLTAFEFEVADVNGTPISPIVKGGTIGKDAESSKPLFERQRLHFPWRNELLLVWRISNFNHVRGGPVNPIDFGLSSAVDHSWEVFNLLELLALGMISIICLYNMVLFLYFRKQQQPLWLSLFCLIIGIRLVVTNNFIEHFYPSSDLFMPLHRINVVTVALAPLTFYMLCRSKFEFRWKRGLDTLFFVGSLFYAFVGAFCSLPVYFSLLIVAHILVVTVVLLAIYLELFAKSTGENKGRIFSQIGIAALCISATLELLSHYEIAYVPVFVSNGLAIFLLLESIRIAVDNQRARVNLDMLAVDLEQSRKQLETVLTATRKMAEVTTPLDAVEVSILALLHRLENRAEATASVWFFSQDDQVNDEPPKSAFVTSFGFGYSAKGEPQLPTRTELVPSESEILAAAKTCIEICERTSSTRRAASAAVSENEILLGLLREGIPTTLVRLCFSAPVASDASLQLFVATLSESLSGILDNIEQQHQERRHLENLVALASSISDKLNSPLMAVQNAAARIADEAETEEGQSERRKRLERLSKIVFASVQDLQKTSKELAVLRDADQVEPTRILSNYPKK